MPTTSKKKLASQAIDDANDRIKAGVNYSANQAKRGTHKAIDLTRKTKHKAKRSARKVLDTSGKVIEETGKSMQRTGRAVKKAA
jgi:hypothetical protein